MVLEFAAAEPNLPSVELYLEYAPKQIIFVSFATNVFHSLVVTFTLHMLRPSFLAIVFINLSLSEEISSINFDFSCSKKNGLNLFSITDGGKLPTMFLLYGLSL